MEIIMKVSMFLFKRKKYFVLLENEKLVTENGGKSPAALSGEEIGQLMGGN